MRKTISFNIPNWISRWRWSNIKNYLTWIFSPPRCTECGSRMNHVHIDYDLRSEKLKLGRGMVKWDLEGNYRENICRHCLPKYITDYNAVPKRGYSEYFEFDTKNTCDGCGDNKKSYKWTSFLTPHGPVSFIMGNYSSWNSVHYCPDCIKMLVEEGEEMGSHFRSTRLSNGQYVTYSVNQLGLPVINGKVRFPLE